MYRIAHSVAVLTLAAGLTLAGRVEAQQYQEHHRGGTQTAEAQAADTSSEASEQGPMMGQMQGMMENMQDMMAHMQSMMGRGRMMGMMERGGMMPRGGMMERGGTMGDDDDDDMPGGGMMGRYGMMGHGGMFMRHAERLMQQLDLTAEQEAKVRSLIQAHMKDAIRAKADIAINRLDLRELLEAESVDMSKVKALLQTIASQKVDLHVAHITLMQDINKLLTPEQQEKFRSMRRHMMRGGKGMMDRGGMRGSGEMPHRRGMMGPGGTQGQRGMRSPGGMMGRGTNN